MSSRNPYLDRGLAFGWLTAVLILIAAFWLFFLAGDLVGVDSSSAHGLMRSIVSARPAGALVGFTVATIASVILGGLFGLAAAFSFRIRRVAFCLAYLVFANLFAISLCTALVAGMNADATLRSSIVANGLASASLGDWLFRYHPLLHGTWILAVGAGFGIGLVVFEVFSKLDSGLSD
jgi:hypothetical protein